MTEKETTTNAVRIMINEEIVTNVSTNLVTDQGTILDLVTTVTREMTNLRIVTKVVETKNTTAGNTAMYARKEDIAGS